MGDRTVPAGSSPRYLVVALAVLAVIAVTLVAAAVAPVFSQERGGDQAPQVQQPAQDQTGAPSTALPDVPFGPIYVAVLVLCAIGVATQFRDDPWGSLKVALGVAAFVGIVYVIMRALMNRDLSPPEQNQSAGGSFATVSPRPNGTSGFEGGADSTFSWPVEGIAVVAIAAAVVALVAVVAVRSDAVRSALGLGGMDDDDAGLDQERIGRVAGAAADRVETASTPQAADNAIYRAWSEMVALLDAPDPQSGTPRQFETAAVERGMDPDDVRELTRTFEAVRYGGASLSDERRERAVTALRRIERVHGDERASANASAFDPDLESAEPNRRDGQGGPE